MLARVVLGPQDGRCIEADRPAHARKVAARSGKDERELAVGAEWRAGELNATAGRDRIEIARSGQRELAQLRRIASHDGNRQASRPSLAALGKPGAGERVDRHRARIARHRGQTLQALDEGRVVVPFDDEQRLRSGAHPIRVMGGVLLEHDVRCESANGSRGGQGPARSVSAIA